MSAAGFDQFAGAQDLHGGLHGTLGKTGFIGHQPEAGRHRLPARARGPAVEVEINQKRGRSTVMADKVAHQHIQDVIIHRDHFSETRHNGEHPNRYTIKWTSVSCCVGRTPLDSPVRENYSQGAMIKLIKLITIPVRDQNRALDFYTEKLGFTIITDQPFDQKQRWIELRIPKAETRLVLFTPEGDEKRIGTFMNLSFECDDIDQTYRELCARGVEFEGPPEKQPWGTYAKFRDSEGNTFVVSA